MDYDRSKTWQKNKRETGYVLGLVMIFFVIFSIIGLSFVKMGGFEQLHTVNYYMKTKAFYQAEAGLNKGMWLLNHVSKAAATFTDSTFSVIYDSTKNEMLSIGTAGSFQDSIQIAVTKDGIFKIQTWKEK